jgi:dihydroorotase
MKEKQSITVPAMIDPHFHLREGADVGDLLWLAYRGGVDIIGAMPNTQKGLTTANEVVEYLSHAHRVASRYDILVVKNFIPIGMMNETTSKADIDDFIKLGVRSLKVYPLNRTTKSHNGVRDYYKLLETIQYGGEKGIKFHFHPEYPWMQFENRDAEWQFLPVMDMFVRNTNATLIWEHGTDARCIPFWKEMAKTKRFFVTLTPHHLLTNESESFGDVRSVCKPSIKTARDREDLVSLVYENHSWVMAGSDSAPHPKGDKHKQEGCCACGAFTAPYILPLYAHALDDLLQTADGVLTFMHFTRFNAQKLHSPAASTREVTLVRDPQIIEHEVTVGHNASMLFWAGKEINWRIETN